MVDVRLDERKVKLVNFCPEITEAELYQKAELVAPMNAERRQAFGHSFRYSAGPEYQRMVFAPQQERIEAESVAKMIHKEVGELGVALIAEPADKTLTDDQRRAHELTQTLRQVEITHRFYKENGTSRLFARARQNGIDRETLAEMKARDYGYYVNEEKAKLIAAVREDLNDELKRVQSEIRRASKGKGAAGEGGD